MLKGNKGEWSEIYTLLKIIGDKKLFAGDSDLNKIENLIFPIIRILRDESNGTYEYGYEDDLVIVKGVDDEFRIPINLFREKAVQLISKLKKKTSSSFTYPEIETFINSFNCTSLKAKSSVKSDIRVVIHDQRTGTTPELGFSIKSQLGSPSTLLNAGRTTNFIYRIDNINLTDDQISEINSINSQSKVMHRIKCIKEHSGKFNFTRTENSTFENNLMLIDSSLPVILSEITYLYYTSKHTKLVDLVNELSTSNPLNYNLKEGHPFYTYKIKRFLTDIALGMMPSLVWTGKLDATGGYLIVKENGEILCYHIYNRNDFEDFLLKNTKLETASTTRHDFGILYKEEQELFFKLNLQIRYIK